MNKGIIMIGRVYLTNINTKKAPKSHNQKLTGTVAGVSTYGPIFRAYSEKSPVNIKELDTKTCIVKIKQDRSKKGNKVYYIFLYHSPNIRGGTNEKIRIVHAINDKHVMNGKPIIEKKFFSLDKNSFNFFGVYHEGCNSSSGK